METILIATDFSPAARNATMYGFELSKIMKAKVILFNAFHIPAAHADSINYFSTNDQEELSYQKLVEEAESLDPLRTVALQTRSCPLPVTNAILSVAEENKATFIVVGMKAHGKEMRKFFGSTVTYLQSRSSIPVIVVPEKVKFVLPKAIALSSENTPYADLHILEPLKKLSELFCSRLFVVRVIEERMNEEFEKRMIPDRLKWFLENIDTSFEFRKDNDVARAINNFVKEKDIDMVAVIPHEHDFLTRLFIGSITKDLVFKTNVALLILPDHLANNIREKTKIANERSLI